MICFFSINRDVSVGSYRIWIKDLNNYLQQIGVQSIITSDPSELQKYKIIIVSKAHANAVNQIKEAFPNKKIGIINLAANQINNKSDFAIVGSIEEKVSLSWHPNVFVFPLIENLFQNTRIKIHNKNSKIKLCYHGNTAHLSKFEFGLRQAIEKLEKNHKLELHVITGDPSYNWQYGRPKIKNLIMKKWNINTIKEDILECDIGLSPNITNLTEYNENYKPIINNEFGLHDTDYFLRLKNKSNAGRSFVFHQLGLPVIADLTPSNFHIMGGLDCGYFAADKNSWYNSLIALLDYKHRQKVASNARKEFDRLYDPREWSKSLIEKINKLEK